MINGNGFRGLMFPGDTVIDRTQVEQGKLGVRLRNSALLTEQFTRFHDMALVQLKLRSASHFVNETDMHPNIYLFIHTYWKHFGWEILQEQDMTGSSLTVHS